MNKYIKKMIAWLLATVTAVSGLYIYKSDNNLNQAAAYDEYFEQTLAGFPESYRVYLRELHAQYPSWQFTALITGLDWNEVVEAEFDDNKCLVAKTAGNLLKSNLKGDYSVSTGKYVYKDATSWVRASKNAVAYYMDPRNFLNEVNIFQFEKMTYNPDIHSQAGVEQILLGTFMSNTKITYYTTAGKKKKINKTYSKVIMEAAESTGVSPYFIASKIRQEVGVDGSGSTSGQYSAEYTGYYNFYNIGASDGANPIANGLAYASGEGSYGRPWTTPEKSIAGGALYLGEEYVQSGQINGYLLKFNVNPDSKWGLYSHQYMTNLVGACQESVSSYSAYEQRGTLSQSKEFLIPVFENMPDVENVLDIPLSENKATMIRTCRVYKSADITSKRVATVRKDKEVEILGGEIYKGKYSYDGLKYPYWIRIQYENAKGKKITGYALATNIKVKSSMTIGKQQTYTIGTYKETSKDEDVYYMSSNPEIATVNDQGLVKTGEKEGNVMIYAFLSNGSFDVMSIRVKGTGSVKLNASSKSITVGRKVTLKAKVSSKIKNKKIRWYSSDKSIAKINQKGIVTGVRSGTAIITAKASNGVGSTCLIKVKPERVYGFEKELQSINYIKLKWEKVKNVRGYKIYRKGKNEKKYTEIATIGSRHTTEYLDRTVTPGETYTYKIRSYFTYEGEYIYSTYSSTQAEAVPRTSVIDSARVGRGGTAVTFKWRYRSGVDGYILYRRQTGEKFKAVRTVKGVNKLKYRDEGLAPGETYYYRIRTFNKVDGKKIYSDFGKTVRVTMKIDETN